ncbi:MAG: hypothetical protein RLZZ436_1326 [Planctomycetota bacterium]
MDSSAAANSPRVSSQSATAEVAGGIAIQYGGESLTLLPSHAVWWPARQTLFVADLHFGKEATFRAAAIPVPDQTAGILERLCGVLSVTGARQLIVLGDLIHARRGRCETTFRQVGDWRRESRADLDVLLVRGNHDIAAGDPPADWHIRSISEPFSLAPFALTHVPPAAGGGIGQPAVAGHLHPMVRLSGPARDSLRLPCFLLRAEVLVLPAFSGFVDGKVARIELGDRVFAVAGQRVVEVSPDMGGGRQRRRQA